MGGGLQGFIQKITDNRHNTNEMTDKKKEEPKLKVTVFKKMFTPVLTENIYTTMGDLQGRVKYEPSMGIDNQDSDVLYQIRMKLTTYNVQTGKQLVITGTFDFKIEGEQSELDELKNRYSNASVDTITDAYLYAINTTIDEINKTLKSSPQTQSLVIGYHYSRSNVQDRAAALLHSHRG